LAPGETDSSAGASIGAQNAKESHRTSKGSGANGSSKHTSCGTRSSGGVSDAPHEYSSRPLVCDRADASLSVDLGAGDLICPTTEGGTRFTTAGESRCFAEVAAEVGRAAEVILDSEAPHGGSRSGLGAEARAVPVGRFQCWGLSVGGSEDFQRIDTRELSGTRPQPSSPCLASPPSPNHCGPRSDAVPVELYDRERTRDA
jgi:hypothetical protein